MNKIIICLLSAYIGFMACNVKKQIHRSTMLTDSLLKTVHSNINKQAVRANAVSMTADSLYAHAGWKELWVDSLLRETPGRNTVSIYGIHWAAGQQKVAGMARSAAAENIAENRIHTSADTALLHTRSQKMVLDTQAERSSKGRGWLLFAVPVIMLVVACCFYKKLRNAFRF